MHTGFTGRVMKLVFISSQLNPSVSLLIDCASICVVVESKQPGNTHRMIHDYLTCFFSECYLTEVNLAGPLSGLVK